MASRKRPDSKSVNMAIRVTPETKRQIRRIRRDLARGRKYISVSDACRLLFELGLVAYAERAALVTHAHAERKRIETAVAMPERPPSETLPAIESEKVAA